MRTTTPPAGRRRRSLLVTAVAALLPACAVLTIDVDVYKGPLTTDPDLQLEQAASLADGVRPLLTELRDGKLKKCERNATWYRTGYIGAVRNEAGMLRSPIGSSEARQVNDILGLYEDVPCSYAPDIEVMADSLEAYRHAWSRYRPDGESDLKHRSTKLVAALKTAEKSKEALTLAWIGFLEGNGNYRPEKPIFLIADPAGLGEMKSSSANARFKKLTDVTFLAEQAVRLFPGTDEDQGSRREELTDVTRQLALQFVECRRRRAELLDLTLDLVEQMATDPGLEYGQRMALVSRSALCVSRLAQPMYLRVALEADVASPETKAFLATWRGLRCDDERFDLLVGEQAYDYGAARRSLAEAIERNGRVAARAIRKARTSAVLIAGGAAPPAMTSRLPWKYGVSAAEYLKAPGRMEFGLIAGVSEDGEVTVSIDEELQMLTSYLATVGATGTFDASRLRNGLNSHIRDYRAAVAQAGTLSANAPEVVRARARLLDCLAAFGMRVLALVNTNQLGRGTSEHGALTEYGIDLLEATFGNSARGDRDGVLILQAIGNILVAQVDLIAAHDHNIRERGPGAEGLRQALGEKSATATGITGETLQELESKLRVRLAMAHTELAAARATPNSAGSEAAKIEKLEKAAADLDAAVKAVQSLRQDSIFIRPASTYLRAANPATELQDGSAIGWRNLLKEHAAHQEPLDTLIPEGARNKRLLTERIDRQSWQNINQIRVAAGGDTTYALVKDDIGNWYVKGFSGDPKPVIDAAQGIALGAYGARVGVDAFAVADGSVSASDAAKQTTESRQLRAMRERYAAAAKDDLRTLDAEYAELANRIGSDWSTSKAANAGGVSASSVLPRIRALQKTSIAAWRSTVPDGADAKTREYVRAIHEGIASLRRFADAARAAIDAETQAVTGDPAVSARREAQRIVVSRTHEIVERAWARRDAAEKAASDGIGVVFPGGPAD